MKRGHAHRSEPAEPAGAPPSARGGVTGGAHALVLVAPFVAGAGITALELVGLRLLAPTFGSSSYVWGGTLAVIMAALAAGGRARRGSSRCCSRTPAEFAALREPPAPSGPQTPRT